MDFNDYAKVDAVNWTLLNQLRLKSPLHYLHAKQHGTPDSPGRQLGRAVHALVFEPETFYATRIITDLDRRGTKEWKALEAANPDKEIIKRADMEDVLAQAEAVRSCPLLADLLDGGHFEQTIQWTDPATGLPCKARLDWINLRTRTIIDLKGAPTVHPTRFGTICAKQGYHIQIGGHYYDAVRYGLGWEPREVGIVAVEFDAPHDVAFYTLDDEDLILAQDERAALMARLKECIDRNEWPGYAAAETEDGTPIKQRIALPRWAFGYDEDETDADELEEMGFAHASGEVRAD